MITLNERLDSFDAFDERLGKRQSRKLANNTYAERRDEDTIAVRLHATDVVTYHRAGTIVLDSGGWLTVTTKDRINSFITWPWRVSSVKGRWYLYRVHGYPAPDELVGPYFDGIVLTAEGVISDLPDVTAEDVSNKEVSKAITKYVKGLDAERLVAIRAGVTDRGTTGDCWFCSMVTKEGQPLGEATGNHGHLLSHLEEGYYVPSLVLNAITEKRYGSPGYIFWNGSLDTIRRALRTYLRKRLVSGVAVR